MAPEKAAGGNLEDTSGKIPSDPDPGSTGSGLIVFPPESPQLRQVKTDVVRLAEIPSLEIVAPGRIVFDVSRVSRVLLPMAGRIDQVLVRLGDTVTPGQPLLTIDSSDADAAVAECRQAEACVRQARAALTKAQTDYERANDLFEHLAIAQKEVQAAAQALADAKAELDQAEASLAHARRQLEILGLRPGDEGQKLIVSTKSAGKVIDLSVTPGEYRSDQSAPLMTVADLSMVWVISDVPENEIRFIEPGERVQVELVAYPGEVFDARVTRIADILDPKTRTVQVVAELPNPMGRLRPEMFGRIRHSHGPRSVPVVPVQSVVRGAGGSFVFVERERGAFEKLTVTTGNPIPLGMPILSGLKQGEHVVTGGMMLLTAMGER